GGDGVPGSRPHLADSIGSVQTLLRISAVELGQPPAERLASPGRLLARRRRAGRRYQREEGQGPDSGQCSHGGPSPTTAPNPHARPPRTTTSPAAVRRTSGRRTSAAL